MHVRCPLCHNRVEVLDDASLADVICPSCGSQFSFFNEETATYSHTPTQRVARLELELFDREAEQVLGEAY